MILDWLRKYLAEGFGRPHPIPAREKGPRIDGWQDPARTFTESEFTDNIGTLYTNDLVDVDGDCPEWRQIAPKILPPTGRIHGRVSTGPAHYWYRCSGVTYQKFEATVVIDGVQKKINMGELRCAPGKQCMVPPSQHPSGETVEWFAYSDIPRVTDLQRAVRKIAIAARLALCWPAQGNRHDLAMAIGGFLARRDFTVDDVQQIVENAATVGRDDEVRDRVRAATDSTHKHLRGEKTTGGKELAKAVGGAVVDDLCRYLDEPGALILDPGDPLQCARIFVDAHLKIDGVRALQHQHGVWYGFNRESSCYREEEDATVRTFLYRFLDRAKTRAELSDGTWGLQPFKPTKAKVESVLDALKAVCHLPAANAAPCWLTTEHPALDPMDLLACRNGLLHIPTRTPYPATPRLFALNGIDVTFDPQAPQPAEWLAFLGTLWPSDLESITTLQEIFGYGLTTDTQFQKAFMYIGPKRSGKGTIGRIQRALVGDRNACAPTLASFGREFGKASLIDKTVAIISDARISTKTDTSMVAETILSITGEDHQTIPRKFLPDWHGKLPVRFVMLSNELPRVGDASGALMSRFILLVMTESFYGREDLGLHAKLQPELPGILNWALEGRDRLYARRHFVQPTSAVDTLEEFNDLGSPVAAFVRDHCQIKAGTETKQSEVFEAYRLWCVAQGIEHAGTAQNFARNLRAVAPGLRVVRHRETDDIQERYWTGLALVRQAPADNQAGVADGRFPF